MMLPWFFLSNQPSAGQWASPSKVRPILMGKIQNETTLQGQCARTSDCKPLLAQTLDNRRGAIRHLELAENVVEIVLHRVGADAERLSHLLVGLPPGNLLEDLSLAQSQRVIVLTGTRGSPGVPSLLGRRRGLGETRSAQSVQTK